VRIKNFLVLVNLIGQIKQDHHLYNKIGESSHNLLEQNGSFAALRLRPIQTFWLIRWTRLDKIKL